MQENMQILEDRVLKQVSANGICWRQNAFSLYLCALVQFSLWLMIPHVQSETSH